ncbi:MAG: ABC transporter permease [Bacteroidia bacterium]
MFRRILIPALVQAFESFSFAWESLRNNKVRTSLSTLGITIGIFCIIMVLTMVDSLERNVEGSIESLGKDVIFIDKWPWDFSGDYKWWKYMNRPNVRLSEFRTVTEKSGLASASAMVVTLGGVTAKYKSNSAEGINILGVSNGYNNVRSFDLVSGRFFTENESLNGSNVVVLGYAIAETLFPNINPLDKEITIRGTKVKVIGVVAKEGESLIGNSMDNLVLLPVQTVANYVRINSDRANAQIQVKASSHVPLEMMEDELRGIMRSIRKLKPWEEQNFALNKTTLITEPLKVFFSVMSIAGWIIGGFSMLVGGFGIANIMFVSVKERTNQIGIQKSLGAKNYFILIEFLVEAVILCLFGGAIGIAMVWGSSYAVTSILHFDIKLSWGNIFTGIFVSVVIGIISGIVPALSASRLNPVDAIRSK